MDQNTMNIFAVIIGPITAVLITLCYQSRKEKRDMKYRAFLVLMAHRKAMPPNKAMIEMLNILDVVFADNQTIVRLWHKYYSLLSQPPCQDRTQTWLRLLDAMAIDLGYPNLRTTDLEQFYIPKAHADQTILSEKLQKELLRVLVNTRSFVVEKKESSEP